MNASPPSTVLWKFDLIESKKNFPNMFATVGISSAPHSTLVAETGFESGGNSLSFAVFVSVFVDTSIWNGIKFRTTGILDRFLRINVSKASSHRIIFPKTRATGIAGRPMSRTSGSACSIIERPSFCPMTWKRDRI